MTRKNMILYSIILILLVLVLWQWISKGSLIRQSAEMQNDLRDLHLLSGIGPLRSTHLHADIKVYINGKTIDFSQRKYQLASRFIHFEDGIGDVMHIHATGHTLGHLFKSLGIDFNSNCVAFEGQEYCNNGDKKLKFYVNGKLNSQFDNYVIRDLDKYLISYGDENESGIQKQLSSITNLAPEYSLNKFE
ncbi:hypothetical protein HY487_01590 [Candidatus Woesearchaeota archaeon]|nr:hypothetical protein [Candidatus Woesearchaeota archaeon]